jgi:hypothetical protein
VEATRDPAIHGGEIEAHSNRTVSPCWRLTGCKGAGCWWHDHTTEIPMASSSRLAHHLREKLEGEGYCVHHGGRDDGPDLAGRFWFTSSVAGMADCEVGPTCQGTWEVWASALDHRLDNSQIEVHRIAAVSAPLEPFHPATLPAEALDVQNMAARYGLSEATAASQIERLRGQAIYMNNLYQVNVEVVREPFGEGTGDLPATCSGCRSSAGIVRRCMTGATCNRSRT